MFYFLCIFCPDGITPTSGLIGLNNTYIYIYIYIRVNKHTEYILIYVKKEKHLNSLEVFIDNLFQWDIHKHMH